MMTVRQCVQMLSLVLLMGMMAPVVSAQAFDEDHKESINGTVLHFRVRGADKSNPYLVILHGGPGFSAHMFYDWGSSIEAFVNVVYLDQRGSGESARIAISIFTQPKPEEVKDYTIANLLKDLEGVREFLKVKRWFVLGHSWGGMLGLEYCTAYPQSISGYIHMDGLLSQPMAQDAILDHAQLKFETEAKGADATSAGRAKAMLPEVKKIRALKPGMNRMTGTFRLIYMMLGELYYARPADIGALNKRISEAIKKYNVPSSALNAQEPAFALIQTEHYDTRDDTPLLDKIHISTLIINGKQDGLITPAMAELAHKHIKGSTLVILNNSGHFPFLEQPEETTAVIRSFVAAHSTKP